MKGYQAKSTQLSILSVDAGEKHQRQIAPIFFIPDDTLIVADKIPAAIDNQFALINLHTLNMMRGVTVNDIHARLSNQSPGKLRMFFRNFVAPVTTPMNGYHNKILRLLYLLNLLF